MARAKSTAGYGQGWKGQSVRHSNARRTGHAGGKYATAKRIDWNYVESGSNKHTHIAKKKPLEQEYSPTQTNNVYVNTEPSPYTKEQVQQENYTVKLYKLKNGKYQYLYPHEAKEKNAVRVSERTLKAKKKPKKKRYVKVFAELFT